MWKAEPLQGRRAPAGAPALFQIDAGSCVIANAGMAMQQRWALVLVSVLGLAVVPAAHAETGTASSRKVEEWLNRQHEFTQRYVKIIQQATHDYSYDYKTPTLLMPVAMDLFRRVAYEHEVEERFMYPPLRPHMTPDQQQQAIASGKAKASEAKKKFQSMPK